MRVIDCQIRIEGGETQTDSFRVLQCGCFMPGITCFFSLVLNLCWVAVRELESRIKIGIYDD